MIIFGLASLITIWDALDHAGPLALRWNFHEQLKTLKKYYGLGPVPGFIKNEPPDPDLGGRTKRKNKWDIEKSLRSKCLTRSYKKQGILL